MRAILYDGWPLAYDPGSPAATHLCTLLGACPEQILPILALPAETHIALPDGVEIEIRARKNTPGDGLAWEQSDLPALAEAHGAAAIHSTRQIGALLGDTPWLVSPCESGRSVHNGGILSRLRAALASGGHARARGIFWPDDLASLAPKAPPEVFMLPAVFDPPGFSETLDDDSLRDMKLPETYVLYEGLANQRDLRRALDAWTWAAGPIGEYYPLLIYNLPAEARTQVESYRAEFELGETVRLLANISARQLGALYRRASVVFSPAPGPAWGNPLRRALAAGKPVVGIEERVTAALLGPAGYLIPPDDLRRLGAAVITVIVEEQVAESLSQAALQRASNWQKQAFANRLAQVYSRVLG